MPREFHITIPCQSDNRTGKGIFDVFFSRNDLHAPKGRFTRSYSNPNGDDNKSLSYSVIKTENAQLRKDAVQFYFDFKKDEAIFLLDLNKIDALGDNGFLEFDLSGKYNFQDKIRINWEKDSLIDAHLYLEKNSYVLGTEDTRIGYIELSPKNKKDCAQNIKVKISLLETLNPCLNVDRDTVEIENGRTEKIIVSVNKEHFKHLPTKLIKGKITVNTNCTKEIFIDFAIGNEEQVKQTSVNRIVLEEKGCLSISSNNEYIFDQEEPFCVYINQKPIEQELTLSTTLPETNAVFSIDVDGNNKGVISYKGDKKNTLKKSESKTISISISPDTKAGIVCHKLKLEADYSLPCKEEINVETKERQIPSGRLEFEFLSLDEDNGNPNPYYIGIGKEKIGVLKILNISPDSIRYKEIPLQPVCDCRFIKLEPQNKHGKFLGGQESACYDVFMTVDERDVLETDEDDLLKIRFSCDNLSPISKSIPVKKRTPEPIKIDFTPIEHAEYKQNGKILVGFINVEYTRRESKSYIPRVEKSLLSDETGTLLLSDEHCLQIQIENGKYPVYYDCTIKFGDIKNIDDIEHVNAGLTYSDSIGEKKIPVKFEIQPINAIPQPQVYVETKDGIVWKNCGLAENKNWQYQFDSRARNNAQGAIIGKICFANKQKTPYKNSFVEYKDIEITGKYLDIKFEPDVLIPNGSSERSFSVKIIYNQIPLTNSKSTELHIKFDIYVDGQKDSFVEETIPIAITEIVTDDWYSLDLGTTGIVVAKWSATQPDETTPIELKDVPNDPIEEDSTIVSSKTILKDYNGEEDDDNSADICECVVRPSQLDLDLTAKYILVPSKFLVGQTHVPFSNLYKLKYNKGIRVDEDIVMWEGLKPLTILQYTYARIFDMVEDDCRKSIRKLIVTYPNTYTPEALNWLRNAIIPSKEGRSSVKELFPILTHENLHFIPESDAVVAYYVNQEINGVSNPTDEENIVIYDMGAGTLDLSYVQIENREIGGKKKRCATILKRIGIPIAGEFFSYLIFKQLKNDLATSSKKWIDILKTNFDVNKTYKDIKESSKFDESVFSKLEYEGKNLEIGKELNEWISICSNVIFIQLLGDDWTSKVDKIVLSGRGSQFSPLKDAIKDAVKGTHVYLDETSIHVDCLKQCVAKGALLYQRIFENPQMPFMIVHKNTYLKMGICYRILNSSLQREWVYKELIGDNDYVWDTEPINGAYHAVVNEKEVQLDLSEDANATFYLTPLSEDEMKSLLKDQDNNKWCFVHELFKLNPSFMVSDKRNAVLKISINKDNILSIVLNDEIDLLEHTTAPNVEENRYFSLCNKYLNDKE